MASDLDEKNYRDIVTGLCQKHGVHVCSTLTKAQIGEYAGRCRRLENGAVTKVVNSSSCVIHNFRGLTQEQVNQFTESV